MSNPLQDDYLRFPKSTRALVQAEIDIWNDATERGVFDLSQSEHFWVALRPNLLSKGYKLRNRYEPGWTPQWKGTDINPRVFEDSYNAQLPTIVDARRISDGADVAIKWIPSAEHTRNEIEVMRFLSGDTLRDDPRNHCNPLLDSFPHPGGLEGVFVISTWLADFTDYPLETVNEVVDMFLQLLEGLVFMHEHGVAHRDCTDLNIMQDIRSAFPGIRTHPLRPSFSEDLQRIVPAVPRSRAAVKYYFIDFGLSKRFEGPGPHHVTGYYGRDQTAPELSSTIPYDPFKLDVYYLGNNFLRDFLPTYSNLEFLRPLLDEMTRFNPDERPSAKESYAKLLRAAREPLGLQFRWRLHRRDDPTSQVVADSIASVVHEVSSYVRALVLWSKELSFGRGFDSSCSY